MDREPTFGPLLRRWRAARKLSQQALSEAAEVSTRHLSCLETGKAQPSREMVLVLASALDLPLRTRNGLLAAAGFTAAYRETSLDASGMAMVRRALEHVLRQQEPYGALVVDAAWNIRAANQGATRFMAAWLPPETPPIAQTNALHAVLHPEGLRPLVVNWEGLAGSLLARLQREAAEPGADESAALLDVLLAYPGAARALERFDPARTPDVCLTLHLRRPDLEARLFTMLTTLGTPLDVTAQELRVETYFPADEATDAWIRRL